MWDQQLQSALCCGLGLKDARHGSLAGNRLGYLSAFAWAKSIGSPLAGYSSKPLRCNHFPPSFFSLSPLRTPSVPLFTLLCLLFKHIRFCFLFWSSSFQTVTSYCISLEETNFLFNIRLPSIHPSITYTQMHSDALCLCNRPSVQKASCFWRKLFTILDPLHFLTSLHCGNSLSWFSLYFSLSLRILCSSHV